MFVALGSEKMCKFGTFSWKKLLGVIYFGSLSLLVIYTLLLIFGAAFSNKLEQPANITRIYLVPAHTQGPHVVGNVVMSAQYFPDQVYANVVLAYNGKTYKGVAPIEGINSLVDVHEAAPLNGCAIVFKNALFGNIRIGDVLLHKCTH